MKIAKPFVAAIVIALVLASAAELRGIFNRALNCASAPAPKAHHVCQYRIAQLVANLPSALRRAFGIGEIWSRIKCELDLLTGLGRVECNK